MKKCRQCGALKKSDAFSINRATKDGRCTKCKECTKAILWAKKGLPVPVPEILPQGLKRCTKCKEVKKVNVFGNFKTTPDGKAPRCKKCTKAIYWAKKGLPVPESIPEPPAGFKRCCECKEEKPHKAFSKSKRGKFGLASKCKNCDNAEFLIAYWKKKGLEPPLVVPPPPEGFKKCSLCDGIHSIACFGNNKSNASGLAHQCRPCARSERARKQAEFRELNPLPVKEIEILPDGIKRCTQCKNIKRAKSFSKDKNATDGRQKTCKKCNKENHIKRYETIIPRGEIRVKKKQRRKAKIPRERIPKWADRKTDIKKIQVIYDDRDMKILKTGVSHHVDHVIALRGKLASGLHRADNLQVKRAVNNVFKSNKFDQDAESEKQLLITRAKLAA